MVSDHSACKDVGSRGLVFAALALAVFAGAASMRILDALLPAIAHQYGQSVGTASIAVSAYALSYSGCQLIYGPLGDRLGPYRIVSWAATLSAGAALLCALAPSLDWLVFCRFMAGGIAAAVGPLTLTWVGHATSLAERPVAVARMSSASILGTAVGQLSSGLFGQVANWRASFVLTAMLFAGAGLILMRTGARRSDVKAVGRVRDASDPGRGSCRLLRRPAVRSTLLFVGLEGLATYMSLTYAAAMMQRHLSLGLAAAGVVVSFFGVGGIAFAILAGRLMKRCQPDLRALLGGGAAAVGFGLIVLMRSPVPAMLCMFCTGFGFFALHNILQVRAIQMAPDAPAAATSLFAATFFLAQAIGAALGGWMFDHFGPSPSFALSAVLLLGTGIAVGRGKRSWSETTERLPNGRG